MFSRPVSSGWKPVPTSSSEPTRPRSRTRPSVGSVMREMILSSVLLPAPFRPMMPTTSPCPTSNDTSRSAQIISSGGGGCPIRRRRRTGALSVCITVSVKRLYRSCGPPMR